MEGVRLGWRLRVQVLRTGAGTGLVFIHRALFRVCGWGWLGIKDYCPANGAAGVTCLKPGDEAGMSLCRACKVGGFDTQ